MALSAPTVKVHDGGADGQGVESLSIPAGDGTLPFPHWRGLLAASVLVGVLVTLISVLFERPEPGQVLGAGACLAAAGQRPDHRYRLCHRHA